MSIVEEICWHLSGASLAYYLAVRLGMKEHFECVKCHNVFEGKPDHCPHCDIRFKW